MITIINSVDSYMLLLDLHLCAFVQKTILLYLDRASNSRPKQLAAKFLTEKRHVRQRQPTMRTTV